MLSLSKVGLIGLEITEFTGAGGVAAAVVGFVVDVVDFAVVDVVAANVARKVCTIGSEGGFCRTR